MSKATPVNQEGYTLMPPLTGVFEITSRCNLQCPHCFVFPKNERELPTEDVKKIISSLKDLGILILLMSGGEPFIREDILQIIDHAASMKFSHVVIPSNCILISDTTIARLKSYKGITIMVSLDASTPEAYDKFRNAEGSFQKVVETVKNLQKASVSVSASTVIGSFTVEELPRIFQLLRELHIKRWFIDRIQPSRTSKDLCYDPSPEQLKKAFQFLFEAQKTMQVSFSENMKHLWWLVKDEPWFPSQQIVYSDHPKCGAAKISVTITSAGDVIPCVQWREPVGNALHQPLKDIWAQADLFWKLRSLTVDQIEVCSHCDHVRICGGGCRAMVRLWGKSLNTPDPRCILTKRR